MSDKDFLKKLKKASEAVIAEDMKLLKKLAKK